MYGYNRDKLRIFLWKKMDNLINIKTKYGKLNYERALIYLLDFMLAQPLFFSIEDWINKGLFPNFESPK